MAGHLWRQRDKSSRTKGRNVAGQNNDGTDTKTNVIEQLPTKVSMYQPDDESPVDEQVDTEPQDDAGQDIVAELDDETPDADEAEADGEADGEEAKAEKPEPKPHNRDKAIQKLQQTQATLERQMTAKIDQLQQAMTDLANAIRTGKGEARQEQAVQAVEDAKDDLAELAEKFSQADEDDIPRTSDLKKMLDAIKGRVATAKPTDEVVVLKKQVDALQSEIQAQKQEAEFYAAFDSQNPDLKGQGRDLVVKANRLVSEKYPTLKGEARIGALDVIWTQVLEEAKKNSSASKPESKTQPKKNVPSKSTTGTHVRHPGASTASRATSSPKAAKPPMYVPDDEV